jgi:hypothetical protein
MVLSATFNIISVKYVAVSKGNNQITEHRAYSIQHYVIEFVSDLRQVNRFLQVLQFPLQIKLLIIME